MSEKGLAFSNFETRLNKTRVKIQCFHSSSVFYGDKPGLSIYCVSLYTVSGSHGLKHYSGMERGCTIACLCRCHVFLMRVT